MSSAQRRPATVRARAAGHCRYDRCPHRPIRRGDSIRIVAGKWYHTLCWRTMAQPAEVDRLIRDVKLTRSTQRIAVALDQADQAAAAARSTPTERRRKRLDAYQAAIHAETRRTIAHYGLENGPDE